MQKQQDAYEMAQILKGPHAWDRMTGSYVRTARPNSEYPKMVGHTPHALCADCGKSHAINDPSLATWTIINSAEEEAAWQAAQGGNPAKPAKKK